MTLAPVDNQEQTHPEMACGQMASLLTAPIRLCRVTRLVPGWPPLISLAQSRGSYFLQITGSTDGGIVIFGSPGSTITGNTITSSSTYLGFGAINMVDDEYSGSYSGVTVSNNKIVGQKMFNLGIGIGANVWSFNDPNLLKGPVTITGNTISGSVSFPIAINGWTNGITVRVDALLSLPLRYDA
jgi:hypothetical protein